MEFQNDNVIKQNHNDHNNVIMADKVAYVCDCGCNLSFLRGETLGFKINVIDEDAILAEDQMAMDWFVYIPIDLIHTWGELMDLFAVKRRDMPNDKVWYHLDVYLKKRNEFADDTGVAFVYIN